MRNRNHVEIYFVHRRAYERGVVSVYAGPATLVAKPVAGVEHSSVLHVAARAQKPAQRHARALKGNNGPVKDTCPGGAAAKNKIKLNICVSRRKKDNFNGKKYVFID